MNKATRHIAKTTAIITISAAVVVLMGWFFNVPALTTILPGVVPIRVNPAICFLLTGIALWFINKPNDSQLKNSIIVACSRFYSHAGTGIFYSHYLHKIKLTFE